MRSHINRAEFLKMMAAGQALTPGSEATEFMHARAVQTRLLCQQLNSGGHSAEQLRDIIQQITGEPANPTLNVVTPLTIDCGINLHFDEGDSHGCEMCNHRAR